MRGTNLDVSEIKEVIGFMKEHNRIFDKMEQELPVANEDGSGQLVEDDRFPNMLDDCKMMSIYEKRLRERISPILQKIEAECDQLG